MNLTNQELNNKDYKKYYEPQRYITTLNEQLFYKTLLEIAEELHLTVLCQVSLYNILNIKSNLTKSEHTTYFNKIRSKSIDFVLVDEYNCRIRLCIELDDKTHLRKDRIERDQFIDELFKQLKINLIHYPVYTIYYKQTLKAKIQDNLKLNYYE